MARNVSSKFGVTDGLDFTAEQGITSIAIDKLIPYHNHRFTLYEGERLEDMIQSIKATPYNAANKFSQVKLNA